MWITIPLGELSTSATNASPGFSKVSNWLASKSLGMKWSFRPAKRRNTGCAQTSKPATCTRTW